jgi:hypothetical protein
MYTYQDLQANGITDIERAEFVRSVINAHKETELYKTARVADLYAKHRNVTISNYQKLLYTVSGKAIPDVWSPSYKMACRHFSRFITQENQYLLGNGVTWDNEDTASKLGIKRKDFDTQLQKAGEKALIGGVSFGFFNLDHVDVFSVLEFAPLYDEIDSSLKAGVRFLQIDESKPLRATLYEIDGYTNFIWYDESKITLGDEWTKIQAGLAKKEKIPYKLKIESSEIDGEQVYGGENYPMFPIVPLWGNPYHQSEFVGLRETIDCIDLIRSSYANDVDEASLIYWTLTNAGGMDDIDLAKFVERLKTIKAVTLDDEVQAESHAVDVPYESREALLDRLEKDLYKDAMALNTENIANGAITATQIEAAYEPLNSKCDMFEYCVLDFIQGILAVAGIENEEPSFTRSKIINVNENIQTVLAAASVLDEDYVIRKVLTLLGDGGKADDMIEKIHAESLPTIDE